MRKIKVVVLLVRQLQHGFTKNAKVSPNLTVTHISALFLNVARSCACVILTLNGPSFVIIDRSCVSAV